MTLNSNAVTSKPDLVFFQLHLSLLPDYPLQVLGYEPVILWVSRA